MADPRWITRSQFFNVTSVEGISAWAARFGFEWRGTERGWILHPDVISKKRSFERLVAMEEAHKEMEAETYAPDEIATNPQWPAEDGWFDDDARAWMQSLAPDARVTMWDILQHVTPDGKRIPYQTLYRTLRFKPGQDPIRELLALVVPDQFPLRVFELEYASIWEFRPVTYLIHADGQIDVEEHLPSE